MRHFVAGLCIILFLASVASAQETPREQALKLLKIGRQLFDRGDFKPALTQFKKAYALSKSWKVLIYIGVAQSRAKQYCGAQATLQRYLEEGGEAVSTQERASVEHELKTIHVLRARVEVVVDGPPGATITVGGERRGKAPLKQPLCLEVGQRTITATLPGYVDARETLDVAPRGQHKVVLALKRKKAKLLIESSPTGAQLWLDGKALGKAPQTPVLVPDEYWIKADLEGYLPKEMKVFLPAKGRELTLTLAAKPPPPWYKRWYWWTIVGGVVTAAAVVGIVFAAQPDYDVSFRMRLPEKQ